MRGLRFVFFLVFITLPHLSHELFVNDDDEQPKPDHGSVSRHKPQRKFQFRKLIRTATDDDNGDDEDDDEDYEKINNEVKFEWVRKADGSKTKPRQKAMDEYGEQYEKVEKPTARDVEEGILSKLLNYLHGNVKMILAPEKQPESSNSLIGWAKSVMEVLKPPAEEPKAKEEDWTNYFHRWPFTALFSIGKPEKKVTVPRSVSSGSTFGNEPISQDRFESLLHSLPAFVINPHLVTDIDCRQQMQIFQRQLRGNKFWTLQMLDATGKIATGMLRGNINQLGDFEECTRAKTIVKVTSDKSIRIRGKYCLAHIESEAKVDDLKVPLHLAHGRGLWQSHIGNPNHFAPRYTLANWGICVPNACSAEVVREMVEANLGLYNNTGVEFRVEVDENDCYVKTTRRLSRLLKKDPRFVFATCYILFFWAMSVTALVFENWSVVSGLIAGIVQPKKNENTEEVTTDEAKDKAEYADEVHEPQQDITNQLIPQEILFAFSPKRTLAKLISQDQVDMEFPVVHVLRILITLMLYICLKYVMMGHLPINNRDKIIKTMDNPMSIVFRSPMIYADLLLVISGFTSAYQLSEEMELNSYIRLIKRFVAKVLRYLPTIYSVLFFQTWILPHLGTGPLWNKLIGQNARLCEQNMWRVLFGVQNAIDFEETCYPATIQMALDLQLYLLAPCIVWLYYTDPDAGFFAFGALQTMSTAARFSRTNLEHLSATLFHGINVSKFYRTANILYSSPITRATPYLIGIGGAILYRNTKGDLGIPLPLKKVGWLIAFGSIGWCFWKPSSGMRTDFIYNSTEAAAFASWYPILLGLAIIWIIFMAPNKDSSLAQVMKSKPILFLSRISFPMQLVTFMVVMYTTAGVTESRNYNISDLVNFLELSTIVLCSTFLAFLVDVPFQKIRNIIIRKIFPERTLQDTDHGSDMQYKDDPEEKEEHHNEIENIDDNDATEDIWGNEPEEEETEYVVRLNARLVNQTEAVLVADIRDLKYSPELEEFPTHSESKNDDDDSEKTGEITEDIEENDDEIEDEEEEILEQDEVIKRPISPGIAVPQSLSNPRDPTIENKSTHPINEDDE